MFLEALHATMTVPCTQGTAFGQSESNQIRHDDGLFTDYFASLDEEVRESFYRTVFLNDPSPQRRRRALPTIARCLAEWERTCGSVWPWAVPPGSFVAAKKQRMNCALFPKNILTKEEKYDTLFPGRAILSKKESF